MSTGNFKCCNFHRIVRLRQLLCRWHNKAICSLSTSQFIPAGVPAGYIPVMVGASRRRFVIRASYLNHPVFKNILNKAEEEHGFSSAGLLAIPCDESVFLDILQFMSRTDSKIYSVRFEDFSRSCNSELGNISTMWSLDRYWDEVLPRVQYHALS